MKYLIIIFILLLLISCYFQNSTNYNLEDEKNKQQEKLEETAPLLAEGIGQNPENIYALINRGADKSISEDYKGAIEEYTRVIEIDSGNALAYLNRGKNKKRMDEFQGAIEDFESAIKTKGGELVYMDKVENSFIDTGFEFDVAIEEIRFERGIAHYNIGSFKLAFDDFNFCIEKNYRFQACHYWRGITYIAYGMSGEGCSDLNKAKELGNSDAQKMIEKHCEK